MPLDKYPKRGDTVYVKINGESKKCTVIEICKDSRSDSICMVKVDEQYGDIIIVHLDELEYGIDSFRDIRAYGNADLKSEAASLENQDEYSLMYKAVNSIESIVLRLIDSASSNKPIGETALLALRDKAEALGGKEIVNAIDTHFEELAMDDDFDSYDC